MVARDLRKVIAKRVDIQSISKWRLCPQVRAGTAEERIHAAPKNGMRAVKSVHLDAIRKEARNGGVDRRVKVGSITGSTLIRLAEYEN
jgi:hypothetical protein